MSVRMVWFLYQDFHFTKAWTDKVVKALLSHNYLKCSISKYCRVITR